MPDPSSPIDLTAARDDRDDRSEDDIDEGDEGSYGVHSKLKTNGSHPWEPTANDKSANPTPYKSSIANGSLLSSGSIDWTRSNFGSSIGNATPQNTKRLRDSTTHYDASIQSRPPNKRQKKDSALPGIIQNISTNLGAAKLHEPGHLILETESLMGMMYQTEVLPEDREKAIEDVLPLVSKGLCDLWRKYRDEGKHDGDMEEDMVTGIGPSENATPLQKASFIAPMLLQLHHPPPITGKQAFASSRSFRMSQSMAGFGSSHPPTRATPIPRVLHEWLREYHDPYASAVSDLQTHRPDPTAHMNYWDILFNMLLRGKVFDVVQTLKRSKFQYAYTAREENGSDGYQGAMLKNISALVSRMTRLFEECPILREDDWDVTGNDWSIFRKRAEQALVDLTTFVEGSDEEREQAVPEIQAPSFGLQSTANSLAQSVRDAERRLPSIIYENLKTMYGVLLGKTPEIVSSAQDWVEATLGLAMWWDGEEDDGENLGVSMLQSRRSLRRIQSRGPRTVDVNPTIAYVRRLAAAFERVTDDDDQDLFQIDSNNSVEVCLASVFEGNVEGVVGLLHSWSLTICSAVVEVANLAGWFVSSAGSGKAASFNQSDLMVLSYGESDQELTSDRILIDYAEALFKKDVLKHPQRKPPVEGWELSMQILSRLEDEGLGIKKLGGLLQQLPLTSDKRVDKLLYLCQSFGLDQEGSDIAEV